MAYQSNEMWSDERCDYIRLPQVRLPPRPDEPESYLPFQHEGYWMGLKRDDYYDRVVSFPTKKTPLPERPGDGRCTAYDYGHVSVGYRDNGESHGFGDESSGPTQRIEDPDYRWPRDDHPPSHQLDYRDIKDGMRRKPMYPNYDKERSPHKRDSPYFREVLVGRREPSHSRSDSIVSSRSYSPDRSKTDAFHQTQPSRNKERMASQPLHTSRDVSPSGTKMALDKNSRLPEKEVAEAASRWVAEKVEKGDTSTVPEISEYEAAAPEPFYVEPQVETGAGITDNKELFEETQHVTQSKAIAAKTKEIEQVPSEFHDGVSGRTEDQGMSGHQPAPDPIPEQKETLHLNRWPRELRARKRKRPAPPDWTLPKLTWGMIKSLTSDVERHLKKNGQPMTPETFLPAIIDKVNQNSVAVVHALIP